MAAIIENAAARTAYVQRERNRSRFEVTSVGIGSFWFPRARLDIQEQVEITRAAVAAVEEHAHASDAFKSVKPEAAEAAMREHFAGSLKRHREWFGEVDHCH